MYDVWFPNLGIKIENLERIAFTIFGIDVYWYGIIIASAVVCGLFYSLHEAKRTNQDPEIYLDFLVYGMIFSIIGARLYYVAFSWDQYKNDLWSIFQLREGGIAIYGAIIGGTLYAYVYTKKKKINFGLFADTVAPALVLGQSIGRWGNFFNREVFGGYTESLFAMRYLASEVGNIPESVAQHIVVVDGYEYIQVQPTFLYESVWNMGIFIFLVLYKKNKKFDGELFILYLFLYGIGRFWIEGLRTDQLLIWNTNIPVSQLISLLLVVFSFVFYITKIVSIKKSNKLS